MKLSGYCAPHSAKPMICTSLLLVCSVFATGSRADGSTQQVTADIVGVENFFAERCLPLEAGQTITYRYESIHPVDFNIHHHPDNNSVVFLRKEENLTNLTGEFLADTSDHVCFTWTNKVERGGEQWSVLLDYQVTNQ